MSVTQIYMHSLVHVLGKTCRLHEELLMTVLGTAALGVLRPAAKEKASTHSASDFHYVCYLDGWATHA